MEKQKRNRFRLTTQIPGAELDINTVDEFQGSSRVILNNPIVAEIKSSISKASCGRIKNRGKTNNPCRKSEGQTIVALKNNSWFY